MDYYRLPLCALPRSPGGIFGECYSTATFRKRGGWRSDEIFYSALTDCSFKLNGHFVALRGPAFLGDFHLRQKRKGGTPQGKTPAIIETDVTVGCDTSDSSVRPVQVPLYGAEFAQQTAPFQGSVQGSSDLHDGGSTTVDLSVG